MAMGPARAAPEALRHSLAGRGAARILGLARAPARREACLSVRRCAPSVYRVELGTSARKRGIFVTAQLLDDTRLVLPSGRSARARDLERATLRRYPPGCAGVPEVLWRDESAGVAYFREVGVPIRLGAGGGPRLRERLEVLGATLAEQHTVPRARFGRLGGTCAPEAPEGWFSLAFLLGEILERLGPARVRARERGALLAEARRLDARHRGFDPVVCKGMVTPQTSFWRDGRVTLVDYRFARVASSTWDLAELLTHLCLEGVPLSPGPWRAALRSYRDARKTRSGAAPDLARLAASLDWHDAVLLLNRLDLTLRELGDALGERRLVARAELARRGLRLRVGSDRRLHGWLERLQPLLHGALRAARQGRTTS
jgi:hypothetical protein